MTTSDSRGRSALVVVACALAGALLILYRAIYPAPPEIPRYTVTVEVLYDHVQPPELPACDPCESLRDLVLDGCTWVFEPCEGGETVRRGPRR